VPVAFFLHFNGDVDATGLGTVLLALATAILAGYTRMSVAQAGKELEQSQRPVLVPLVSADVQPHIADGRFLLPLMNVGVGPAMQVSAEIEFGDVDGNPSAAPRVWDSAGMTAVGAGKIVMLEFRDVALASPMGFAFNVQYHDVSGKAWHSRAAYSEAKASFRDVEVHEGALSEAQKYRIYSRVGHA